MSILSIFRMGLKAAEWATPHVQKHQQAKHLNRTEGQRHLQARNYTEAEKYLTAALGDNHSKKHQAEILVDLARTQLKLNKLAPAEQSVRAALGLTNDAAAEWDAAEVLAEIQAAQGQPAAAIETLKTAEALERARSRPDLQRMAKTSVYRGKLLVGMRKLTEGVGTLNQALKLAEQAWGPGSIETAHILGEIGSIYTGIGDHKQAQELLARALKIYKATSGLNSADASRGLLNLAMSLEASGDMDEAAAEYERFVTASERQVGYDAMAIANAKIRLGALYVQAGRFASARELLMPVIGMLERSPGEALRDALEIMAVAEDESGRPNEAEKWRAKASQLMIAS